MNFRLSAILVGALLFSLALLWFPELDPGSERPPAQAPAQDKSPELTIMGASVRSFGDDGTLNWSMHSPRIAYHLDGGLDFNAPIMLLRGGANANLRAYAGQGTLQSSGEHETILLYSNVSANFMRGQQTETEVRFDTAQLVVTDQGRQVVAPDPVHINSLSIDTRAANLELNLEKQILLLGSANELPVSTRIQPMGIFK